jgi:hypothetical protein
MSWNETVEKPIQLACGAEAIFDHNSGISYRCTTCGATVGSIGMPQHCKEAEEAQKMWDILAKKQKIFVGSFNDHS